jgi:VacB/RNase II family 3'-5' exoribonuclease
MEFKAQLVHLAYQVMKEKGLQPEFSEEALQQLAQINRPASLVAEAVDLSSLLWCSIDNDDSRDLDQLTYAEKAHEGHAMLWVAIADVDALVEKASPIDQHAAMNTTSVYTPAKVFSMLPEKLSTDLTSLNENEQRASIVVKIQISPEGEIESSWMFLAFVSNRAKLTYNSIGAWLEGKEPLPDKVKQVAGLEQVLKTQHEIAQLLKKNRHEKGALTLESSEAEVKIDGAQQVQIQLPQGNYAYELIEEFMIAANRAAAHFFKQKNIPHLQRVVRVPKFWKRIVEVAQTYGEFLPAEPDSKALDQFLIKRKEADPGSFPNLSLTVIKLLGRGEYIVENDPEHPVGHFALALKEYTHFTAPNRRFPDLISQRQYKAVLHNEKALYSLEELRALAMHCSQQEDAAMKVERRLNKCAAAAFLSSQIGTIFNGIITGAGKEGTWVRIFHPYVEGKLISGFEKMKVGDKVSVQLKYTDVAKGFIDFVRVERVQKGER